MTDVNNNPGIKDKPVVPPLTASADVDQAPAPVEQVLSKCDAGYVLDEDHVIVGELSKDGSSYVEESSFAGEMALLCDANWQSVIPRRYRLAGIQMSKDEAQCLRRAWGFGRDGADREALALDRDKAPGTWCIEKMNPSAYEVYLDDSTYKGWRDCLDGERETKLEGILRPKTELDRMFTKEGVAVSLFGALTLFFMFVWPGQHLGSKIQKTLFGKKGGQGPDDDPPPAGSGGGGELPVASKAPVPSGAASAPKMSMAEKAGLIGLAIMGGILMYFAGPAAISMGLQGSAAGGAGMVGPGLMGGSDEFNGA